MSASRTVCLLRTIRSACNDIINNSPSRFRNFNTKSSTKITYCNNQSAKCMFNTEFINSSCRQISGTRLTATNVDDKPNTRLEAEELVLRLNAEERTLLLTALQEFESNKVKAEYEEENVPSPTLHQLLHVALHNAIPFIGFGFLDNAIMIIAGDQIEISLGAVISISTMAAAALGNTISDVLGIGSAWYVEQMAAKVGMKPPNLSPIQLDMPAARGFSNLGRALGIIIGCLLGMLPLLFMKEKKPDTDKK